MNPRIHPVTKYCDRCKGAPDYNCRCWLALRPTVLSPGQLCFNCGVMPATQVHHRGYLREPRACTLCPPKEYLLPLCPSCHLYITMARRVVGKLRQVLRKRQPVAVISPLGQY